MIRDIREKRDKRDEAMIDKAMRDKRGEKGERDWKIRNERYETSDQWELFEIQMDKYR